MTQKDDASEVKLVSREELPQRTQKDDASEYLLTKSNLKPKIQDPKPMPGQDLLNRISVQATQE